MNSFEWFLLIVVVIVVPLIVAVVVTLWTIDQANKRKRANRKDAQIGVKRKAALSPEEVAARKAARAEKQAEPDGIDVSSGNQADPDNVVIPSGKQADPDGNVTINDHQAKNSGSKTVTSSTGNTLTINSTTSEPE